jgi:3-hydroxy-9,10-secoandrosta-1,3,5(10)-triene-9,17-dione monooxygenase
MKNQTFASDLPVTSDYIGLNNEIFGNASGLVDVLRKNAASTDLNRSIPEENLRALDEVGFWGLTRPLSRGGYQANVRTTVECIAEMARGCGSTAWCVGISTIEQLVLSFLDERAQEDIYAVSQNPKFCGAAAPTCTARRVEGGIVLTGRWGWCSNSEQADWAFLGLMIPGLDGEADGQAVVPMSACEIEKTWDAAGLAGTGSHHVSCKDVFVPEYRILNISKAKGGDRVSCYPGTLYQSAFSATLSLMNASPTYGLAKAALEFTLSMLPDKPVTFTNLGKARNAAPSQMAVGLAASKVQTSHMHLASAADMIDRAALEGRELTLDEKARARMSASVVAREGREAVDLLLDAYGASSFARSNPLQLAWRDISVASRHGYFHPTTTAQIYGGQLLKGNQIATIL